MATQYFCQDAQRRKDVEQHGEINGIDYLEVLDLDLTAPGAPASPRQQTLFVHFYKPLKHASEGGLTGDTVVIEGGVRITPVRVRWAAVASDTSAIDNLVNRGELSLDEKAFLQSASDPHPQRVLLVRTDAAGDFSTYRLSIRQSSGAANPPMDFDPLLSEVDFSFKVECPSDFDCQTEVICPTPRRDEPVLDYLAKDYASFRRLILDRLSVIMPDWQERNPADLGITLVELLAYAGDRLSYFQDAVGAEAYLGTARRRVSVRRHARLLDYLMHDGCNARAWVALEVESASDGAVLSKTDPQTGVPALMTRIPGEVVVSADDFERQRLTHRPEVFELMHDVVLYESHNKIRFYPWRDQECCLPKGATRATLYDDAGNRLRLRAGDVLIFEEQLDSGTGLAADANPQRRHAVRLTQVTPEAEQNEDGGRTPAAATTDPLNVDQPIVGIEWDAADALPFPFCISAVIDGELVENISIARGNVVLSDHGRRVVDEALPRTPAASSRRRYRPLLSEPGVTFRVPVEDDESLIGPASEALSQDPRDALPAVELEGDGEQWIPRRDLLDSGRFDPHFVVEAESDGVSQLRFARRDDLSGKTPSAEAEFQATYRVGNGTRGNVGAESIARLVVEDTNRFAGVRRVRNPLSASGGIDPESAERVRLDATQAFRIQQRAVTEQDYAEVAQRHPEVQKAVATRRWTGSWHTMFLTVDRRGGLPVNADFRDQLRDFLECFRLVGHDLEIDPPRFVPLEIVMTVCVAPGYFASDVKQALLGRFASYDLRDGQCGFFHPDNFTFGESVFLSRVISTAMEISGVLWVDLTDHDEGPNRFRRFDQASRGEFDAGRIDLARLEIARLDNDPSLPENGKIEFLMEGGA